MNIQYLISNIHVSEMKFENRLSFMNSRNNKEI